MDAFSKRKLLTVVLPVALGLGMAGQVQAAPFWTGTVQDWDNASPPGITDVDADSVWTHLFNDDALDLVNVSLEEVELATVEWYIVNMDFRVFDGLTDAGPLTLEYMGQKTDDELFSSVHLDIDHVGDGVLVEKWVYADANFTDLLWSGSSTGAPVEGTYSPTQTIYVRETYTAGPAGILHESTNAFNVVPEPGSLLLLGAGLAGLGLARRQRKGMAVEA